MWQLSSLACGSDSLHHSGSCLSSIGRLLSRWPGRFANLPSNLKDCLIHSGKLVLVAAQQGAKTNRNIRVPQPLV